MDIKTLYETPPWDRPQSTPGTVRNLLKDKHAPASDRVLAAGMAGEYTIINDDLVADLLAIIGDAEESTELRARASISLGPALEGADTEAFEIPDTVPISEETFQTILEALQKHYYDEDVPKEVRRRILEAAVRAPQDWHAEAIGKAYQIDDEDWQLTAVFGMAHIRGFDEEILSALTSKNKDIQYEAIRAAGNWEVAEAWPHVQDVLLEADEDSDLLYAAIEAAAFVNPDEAIDHLRNFTQSENQDVVDAAYEALGMAEGLMDEDYDEDEDEYDEDFDFDFDDEVLH